MASLLNLGGREGKEEEARGGRRCGDDGGRRRTGRARAGKGRRMTRAGGEVAASPDAAGVEGWTKGVRTEFQTKIGFFHKNTKRFSDSLKKGLRV